MIKWANEYNRTTAEHIARTEANMAKAGFKRGDTVRTKTSSIIMTIERASRFDYVHCGWEIEGTFIG